MTIKSLEIYTDGSCVNNGMKNAKGGIGIYILKIFQDGSKEQERISIKYSEIREDIPTNNKAELLAIQIGLKKVKNLLEEFSNLKVNVISDSNYSIKTLTEYAPSWMKTKTKLKDKKNLDIILPILEEFLIPFKTKIKFTFVNSHRKKEELEPSLQKFHRGNEIADYLALSARG